MRTWVWAAMGAAALGACDSVTIDDNLSFGELVDRNTDLTAEVSPLPIATSAEMPTSGSATYDGTAALALDTSTSSASLVGEATIDADFGNGTLSGTIDNVAGTVNGESAQSYDGSLAITDGTIGNVVASGWDASVAGSLASTSHEVTVDGSLGGTFRSGDTGGSTPDASGIIGASGADTVLTLDGDLTPGVITVVGIR